jgi:hypothetical protein
MDDDEVEPTPLTLPRLPTLVPAPTSSGQKKTGGTLVPDNTKDTGSSGSGVHPTRGQVETPPSRASFTPTVVIAPSRGEAMAAILAAPALPGPSVLLLDHVSALLFLLI